MKSRKNSVPAVPFEHFFTYAELVHLLKEMASSRPNLAKLTSLGKSREGRDIWCLTITDFGSGAPEDKPTYVIHGNIHAAELSGTHAALYTARELLAGHSQEMKILERVAFQIIPRINPDGAEVTVTNSTFVRSRIDRANLLPNTLVQKDIDGNGIVVSMRVQRPDGEFTTDPKDSRLMIRRKPDSQGPFYKIFPEGEIVQWDGSENIVVEGRYIDWNRQFPFNWKPEPEQVSSGDFPYSEPEMRTFAEFIAGQPNIFGVLGYHCGAAAVLRAPGSPDDNALDEGDVRKMVELGVAATKHTGLPCLPVYRYCNKKNRGRNSFGNFSGTAYEHWGLIAFDIELGTKLDSAGMGCDAQLSWETDEDREEGQRRLMRWWDRQRPKPELLLPWTKFNHPQLGPVEIGGQLMRAKAGMTMPHLKKRCAGTHKFTLHHAAQHPRVGIESVEAGNVGGGVWRVRARIANRGAFPTHVTNRGAKLSRLRTVSVQILPDQGAELLSLAGCQDLGHLPAVTGCRQIEWFVRARKGAACRIEVKGRTGGNCSETVRLA